MPYFEQCRSLFEKLRNGATLRISLSTQGNSLLAGDLSYGDLLDVQHVCSWLNPLHQLRLIGKRLGKDFRYPAEMTQGEADDIDMAHRMLFDCEDQPGEGVRFAMSMTKNGAREFADSPVSQMPTGPLRLGDIAPQYEFVGEMVNVGRIDVELDTAELLTHHDEIVARIAQCAEDERVTVEWQGAPGSRMRIKRLD